jgi:hypothetical protein
LFKALFKVVKYEYSGESGSMYSIMLLLLWLISSFLSLFSSLFYHTLICPWLGRITRSILGLSRQIFFLFVSIQGAHSLVPRRPFFTRFLQLCIIFPPKTVALDQEDSKEEGDTATWYHEVVDVTNAMGYGPSILALLKRCDCGGEGYAWFTARGDSL